MNAELALKPLLNDLGGDRQQVRELVEMFLDEAPRLMKEGRAALAAKDAPVVQRAYHTLKGSSAQFGLEEVRQQSLVIEQAARGGVMPSATQLATLDKAWAEAQKDLAAWAKAVPAA